LSVSASLVAGVKAGIRALNQERCQELARRALALSTAAEVHGLLDEK
jgi:phosphoenolpyruvate-protein kinase (PTS system EI component)